MRHKTTPEDKAQELLQHFKPWQALIFVDFIIDEIPTSEFFQKIEFWEEVKKELEN